MLLLTKPISSVIKKHNDKAVIMIPVQLVKAV